jgi:hypothetical protein
MASVADGLPANQCALQHFIPGILAPPGTTADEAALALSAAKVLAGLK